MLLEERKKIQKLQHDLLVEMSEREQLLQTLYEEEKEKVQIMKYLLQEKNQKTQLQFMLEAEQNRARTAELKDSDVTKVGVCLCAVNLSNSSVIIFSDCDIVHYLLDIKVKEKLLVSKQIVQKLMRVQLVNKRCKSLIWRINFNKL
jgi:hypothetical protein